jgi:hypothetical protein
VDCVLIGSFLFQISYERTEVKSLRQSAKKKQKLQEAIDDDGDDGVLPCDFVQVCFPLADALVLQRSLL